MFLLLGLSVCVKTVSPVPERSATDESFHNWCLEQLERDGVSVKKRSPHLQ